MGNIVTVMMVGAILGFAICYIRKEKSKEQKERKRKNILLFGA